MEANKSKWDLEAGEEEEENRSKMSRLLQGGLALSLLPVSVDKHLGKINFQLVSKETFKFSCLFYGPIIGLFLFWMMGGLFDALLEGLPNTMEKVTFAVMILSQYCNFILPFPLTLGLTKVPALALSKQLCWPRFGLLHLVGYLITLLSIPISKHTIPDLIRPVKSNQTYMVSVVV